ncbi:hypothetical protein Xbud_01892 [Xenorhabdus budapestensis]|uniref:Uncharacterized protein n=1 Tax=Xenorhabdus budapestensis TaxID=290110 RepID=A0A2D0J0M9_XENBU|nr:hypothetical protein Xbud_01892 [Xenorhabdus budapestensis]
MDGVAESPIIHNVLYNLLFLMIYIINFKFFLLSELETFRFYPHLITIFRFYISELDLD